MENPICPLTKKPCIKYGCEKYNRFIGCELKDGPKREDFKKAWQGQEMKP